MRTGGGGEGFTCRCDPGLVHELFMLHITNNYIDRPAKRGGQFKHCSYPFNEWQVTPARLQLDFLLKFYRLTTDRLQKAQHLCFCKNIFRLPIEIPQTRYRRPVESPTPLFVRVRYLPSIKRLCPAIRLQILCRASDIACCPLSRLVGLTLGAGALRSLKSLYVLAAWGDDVRYFG